MTSPTGTSGPDMIKGMAEDSSYMVNLPKPPRAPQLLTVVGGIDDARIAAQTCVIQRRQHLPYLRVKKSADAVIRGVQAANACFVKGTVAGEVSPHVFECRMPDPLGLAPLRRQFDLVVSV